MLDPNTSWDTCACLTNCDSMKPIVCKHGQHVDGKIWKYTIDEYTRNSVQHAKLKFAPNEFMLFKCLLFVKIKFYLLQ